MSFFTDKMSFFTDKMSFFTDKMSFLNLVTIWLLQYL